MVASCKLPFGRPKRSFFFIYDMRFAIYARIEEGYVNRSQPQIVNHQSISWIYCPSLTRPGQLFQALSLHALDFPFAVIFSQRKSVMPRYGRSGVPGADRLRFVPSRFHDFRAENDGGLARVFIKRSSVRLKLRAATRPNRRNRSEEHTSELQSPCNL